MYFKEQDMEINRNNYETFFLLYLDRELNPSEMLEVERFVNDNADLQKEFSLLRQTILIPAQIEFDRKELLFRKENKRRVIPLYWTRMAAAVAVLVLSGWLLTTQLLRKQGAHMASSDSKMNMVPVKKNSSDHVKEANTNEAVLSDAASNKMQPAVQQNIKTIKNLSAGNYGKVKNRIKPENDLSGKNNPVQPLATANPELRNPSSNGDPDGDMLAMQKPNAQELQPVDSRIDADPKQISAQPGSHSPVPLIAATGTAENVKYENAVLVENEDQTDNAISVVALNDKNKGITRLFKKLTGRAPTVENERKVRVSVFQFSY
jgi:hypothetical protein